MQGLRPTPFPYFGEIAEQVGEYSEARSVKVKIFVPSLLINNHPASAHQLAVLDMNQTKPLNRPHSRHLYTTVPGGIQSSFPDSAASVCYTGEYSGSCPITRVCLPGVLDGAVGDPNANNRPFGLFTLWFIDFGVACTYIDPRSRRGGGRPIFAVRVSICTSSATPIPVEIPKEVEIEPPRVIQQ